MALKRYGSSVFNRPDGSRMWVPPDAVFTPTRGLDQDINIEETGTEQKFSLGTRLEDIFGRVFRYVEFGGTIAQASMVQAEVPAAEHDDLDLSAAVVAGDTAIEIASPASGTDDIITDEYAQGWLYAELVVSGIAYPIALNDAMDISEAGSFTVTLFVPARTAIVVDSDISLVKSKFKEVIIAAAAATAAVVGANVGSGAGDGDFGWVQTRGPAKVLTAGTAVIGEVVTVITTAGAVGPTGADDVSQRVGQVINVGPTTEWSLIDLALE